MNSRLTKQLIRKPQHKPMFQLAKELFYCQPTSKKLIIENNEM